MAGEVYKHYGVICREERQMERAETWFLKAAGCRAQCSRPAAVSGDSTGTGGVVLDAVPQHRYVAGAEQRTQLVHPA